MEGLRQPVGDQPADIYWRRRLAVIGVVVILALLTWWGVSAFSASNAPTSPSPSPSVTTTAQAPTDLTRECVAADLSVTTAAELTYGSKTVPTFTVTAENVGDSPCLVKPGDETTWLEIRSGSDVWFDSRDCGLYAPFGDASFLLSPGDTYDLQGGWNRGRGDAGCSTDEENAKKGYYWVEVTVVGAAAEAVQFELK